jgi:hypothetical protein
MWAALRQLGDCGLAKRECCGRAPATTLAQARKHPHNWRSHDNASFDPGSGEAALRRSASANVAVGCQLRAWLRCTNIRTTGGAMTTPASTVAQVRRLCADSPTANLVGRAAASSLAQVRRLCADSLTANLASERRQNALVRPCSCLKSGALYPSRDVAVRALVLGWVMASIRRRALSLS